MSFHRGALFNFFDMPFLNKAQFFKFMIFIWSIFGQSLSIFDNVRTYLLYGTAYCTVLRTYLPVPYVCMVRTGPKIYIWWIILQIEKLANLENPETNKHIGNLGACENIWILTILKNMTILKNKTRRNTINCYISAAKSPRRGSASSTIVIFQEIIRFNNDSNRHKRNHNNKNTYTYNYVHTVCAYICHVYIYTPICVHISLGTKHLVPSTWYQALATRYFTWYGVIGIHLVPSTRYTVWTRLACNVTTSRDRTTNKVPMIIPINTYGSFHVHTIGVFSHTVYNAYIVGIVCAVYTAYHVSCNVYAKYALWALLRCIPRVQLTCCRQCIYRTLCTERLYMAYIVHNV